jgi:hypothetical protein
MMRVLLWAMLVKEHGNRVMQKLCIRAAARDLFKTICLSKPAHLGLNGCPSKFLSAKSRMVSVSRWQQQNA